MNHKAIFFDVDGVLVQNKHLFSDKLQADYGISMEKMLPFFTGPFRLCSVGKADLKVELMKVVGEWGWQGTVDELVTFWLGKGTQLDHAVLDFVKSIRDLGVRCFVATDNERYRGEYLEQMIGSGQVFEHVFFSAAAGCSKAEPEFWKQAFDHIGGDLRAEDCFFVDDDLSKVEAVAKFGLETYRFIDLGSLTRRLGN